MATTSGTLASDGPTSPDGGDGPSAVGPAGRGYEPMSVRGPALVVLGLAVLILVGGVVASALSSGSDPTFTLRQVTLADGTTVVLVPAATRLQAIESNDEPPADILGNLGVPRESTVGRVVDADQGSAQFDRTADLTSHLAQGQVVEAYDKLLRAVGWQVIYDGPAPQGVAGSTEVLAKKGSGDGFYWETGVVVSPTTPAGVTAYSVEVLETPDGN